MPYSTSNHLLLVNKKITISILLYILLALTGFQVKAQDAGISLSLTPGLKPGLTLSGGGAKGLAHIGVLHILDSLGVKVNYISGTSMGSIIGAMYASGYSAREIEKFALEINWDILFATKSSLNFLPPQERNTAGKNIIELPIDNGKIKIPSGALEGQQLWNTLNEIYLPVYSTTDFNELPIPFACVATDVETGTPVLMTKGSLSSAIRASMAIPSIFTTVDRDGKKLIDGGVVKNFPVSVVKDMGADFTIGVNVSQGLRPAVELKTPVDIIYQMGFYVDAHNFIYDKGFTDLYIEPDLTGYSAASFKEAAAIIEQGKTAARKQLGMLKKLAETQKIAGIQKPVDSVNLEARFFIIDSITVIGSHNIDNHFIRSKLNINRGDTLKAKAFTHSVNRLYASNYFERINYYLTTSENKERVILNVEVIEKPLTSIMTAINYSTFNGVGIIAGWRTNRFLFNNTQAYVRVQIGQNPVFRAGLSHFLTKDQKCWLNLETNGTRFKFPVYENFKRVSEYRQDRIDINLSANILTGLNSYITAGSSFFYRDLEPKLMTDEMIEGNNTGFETSLLWRYHTLNRNSFPLSGQKLNLQTSLFHNQNPSLKALTYNGNEISPSDLDIEIGTFVQTSLLWESYAPVSNRFTQIFRVQAGYNFNYTQGFINSFNVGGTSFILDKQFTFTGLNEYAVITSSIVSGAAGLQYSIGSSLFASALVNAGMYDFAMDDMGKVTYSDNVLLGAGLCLGYLSLLGPIEITFSYSPQTDKIIGYLNLGWSF
ncbi:MAG: patatin-like phospholipase family protein [Bacteroidales bacterium]|nr:patatin-like phospholipase family protein [Bacteroidales bacterium]